MEERREMEEGSRGRGAEIPTSRNQGQERTPEREKQSCARVKQSLGEEKGIPV